MTNLDPHDASFALATKSPLEVLEWAAAHAGRVVFATGFGAEGCVLIDLVGRHRLPIDLVTLDTGFLFPETHALWKQLEAKYGVTIRAIGPEHAPDERWRTDPDGCCERRKVAPLRRVLAGYDAWITAIRRDQTPERATAQLVERDLKFGLVKVNPLAAWTHDEVWGHLYANDVPANALHERGYPSIGCMPCTSVVAPGELARAGRWRGAAKRECGLHVQTAPAKEQTS